MSSVDRAQVEVAAVRGAAESLSRFSTRVAVALLAYGSALQRCQQSAAAEAAERQRSVARSEAALDRADERNRPACIARLNDARARAAAAANAARAADTESARARAVIRRCQAEIDQITAQAAAEARTIEREITAYAHGGGP
jgi:hypothetical protein